MGDDDLTQRSQGLGERSLRAYALEQRDSAMAEAAELLRGAKGKPDGASRTRINDLFVRADQWASRVSELDERSARRGETARVVREPLTYDCRANPGNSWIRDHVLASKGDGPAGERLERHANEMRVEMRARAAKPRAERRSRGDLIPADAVFERRAVAPEAISSFTPPLWLIDHAVLAVRPERVIGDLVPSFPLDRGVSSINLPRFVQGTQTAATRPKVAGAGRDFTDDVASSPVVPIAGLSDFPLAMIEGQSFTGADLDQRLWADMLNDYDLQLERMILDGKGTLESFLGINNIAGTESITYTSVTPKAINAYPLLGQAFGTVSDNRKIRPECWVIRGGRWAWWATSEDEQGRPLGVDDAHNPPPTTPEGVPDPIGGLLGLPVFTSEAISSTLGAGENQDQMLALRPRDMLLFESEPVLNAFEQPLSGTMEVRLSLRKSAAFIGGRYPSGICSVGGTGFVVPTNE
jgi:hypothetical protein